VQKGIADLKTEFHNGKHENGFHLSGAPLDVRDQASVEKAVDTAMSELGDVDILVNNAGRGGGGPTVSTPEKVWFDVIEVNLNGTYRMTRTVLSRSGMIKQKWGRIINMASTGGKQGVQLAAAYTASKHGVVGFSKSLGLELAKTGVTVNSICPGFVETDLAKTARDNYAKVWGIDSDEVLRRFEARIPIGRYVNPEEIAPLAVMLASDTSAAITAQAINVCGGLGNY
ncbi:MAG TPA: SDR family oxidoreductase, partial [Verrucomicrobiae bacterium]|nr:SDR family oxidoreductase [Verrucomicrobiae bacterium]